MKFGPLIGAIDEGTSSARCIIFRAGTDKIICHHQIEVTSIYPQEGWVEQDPILIYKIVVECIEEAVRKLKALGASEKDIIAFGITNQRETTIVWDRNTGKPLYNAIVWMDNRTTTTVDQLIENIPSNSKNLNYLKPLCGLPLSPYFSALKLCWLRDNVAQVKKAMEDDTCMFGNVDTWLLYNLTGGINGGHHLTDVTNASRTMLMNLETLQWDNHLLKFFELPATILPKIYSCADKFGTIKLNTLNDVPITAILGDQQAALVGQQCLNRGQAKATYGTGCFLLYNTGGHIVTSTHGLLTTVGYQFGRDSDPIYALEGSVAIAGAAINWLRDNMGIIESVKDVERMARTVDNSLDVYFVPAFSGLYAPYWNQEARGVICGLSEETTSEHIVRATLESVCFQVRDILDAMRKDCGIPLSKLMVDGGMTVNTLLVQLQSDLVGIKVVPSQIAETTALGVALTAYKVVEPSFDIEKIICPSDKQTIFKPKISENERDLRYGKWKMAVERSIGWDTSPMPNDLFD